MLNHCGIKGRLFIRISSGSTLHISDIIHTQGLWHCLLESLQCVAIQFRTIRASQHLVIKSELPGFTGAIKSFTAEMVNVVAIVARAASFWFPFLGYHWRRGRGWGKRIRFILLREVEERLLHQTPEFLAQCSNQAD